MIQEHQPPKGRDDVWRKLAAPMPPEHIQWRIDGKAKTNERGDMFARVVAYCDVPSIIQRLDAVVPGTWDYHASDPTPGPDGNVAVKGRIQIEGVVREDYGIGSDPKQANTDAFKRAARLFGIALELWSMEGPLFVRVTGKEQYPTIAEDCNAAYQRKFGRNPGFTQKEVAALNAPVEEGRPAARRAARPPAAEPIGDVVGRVMPTEGNDAGGAESPADRSARSATRSTTPESGTATDEGDVPACPDCGSSMYDNRKDKRNPRAPDFKCKRYREGCEGAVWPDRKKKDEPKGKPARQAVTHGGHLPGEEEEDRPVGGAFGGWEPGDPPDDDDLPF